MLLRYLFRKLTRTNNKFLDSGVLFDEMEGNMEDLLNAINILKNFDIENDPVSKLRQAVKIVWDNDIKPTEILMAIDLIEDEDEDEDGLAEDHIEQAIKDLEKITRNRKFQQSK